MNKYTLLSLLALYPVVSLIVLFLFTEPIIIPALIVLTGLFILFFLLQLTKTLLTKIHDSNKQLNNSQNHFYKQLEALFNLYEMLDFNGILPRFRGWAISPDFATLIVKKILQNKPTNILECGSGVSTLVIAYALHKNEQGKLISLEHNPYYADKSLAEVSNHHLNSYVDFSVKDLKPYNLKNDDWHWYNIEELDHNLKLDMVVIDGPPANVRDNSRFPALYALDNFIQPNGIVLVDDCNREGDNEVVQAWLSEFDNYEAEWIETEKGSCVLTKKEFSTPN